METIETPQRNWMETVREHKQQLDALLNAKIPDRVRNGSVNVAIDFKYWAMKARKLLNGSERSSERLAIKLVDHIAEYRQF